MLSPDRALDDSQVLMDDTVGRDSEADSLVAKLYCTYVFIMIPCH